MIFKNFCSCEVLRMLKMGCLTVSQTCFKVLSQNFLINSVERHVVVISFTHVHSSLQQILIFQKFQ